LIFLTVGNWPRGYDRLVEAVDRLREQDVIAEEVIAQIGAGSYRPQNLNFIDYCSPAEFTDIVTRSRAVIAHAGVGTIAQAIELGKPIIVVPRKASLGEHLDDHQYATAKQLEAERKVLVAYEVSELSDKLEQANTFVPAEKQGAQRILETVEAFLNELSAKRLKGCPDE
jgi:UDP-N-acetylglucosamine transferase subunit ALG13